MEPQLKSKVLGIAVGVTLSIGAPQTVAAQQIGRMQVHVTVVDVSQSRHVLSALRRVAEHRPERSLRDTSLLPNVLLIRDPGLAEPPGKAELPREQEITVFYY